MGALGKGIATAFVATFYGVGLANIILLHAASAASAAHDHADLARALASLARPA